MPDSRVYVIEVFSIRIPREWKTWNFLLRDLRLSKFSDLKLLFIADYENIPKFVFDWLAAKLWLKDSTILWNDYTFEWMNLDEYQRVLVCKSSSSFGHKFYIFVASDYQSLISKNLKVVGLLREKFHFSFPCDIKLKYIFIQQTQ